MKSVVGVFRFGQHVVVMADTLDSVHRLTLKAKHSLRDRRGGRIVAAVESDEGSHNNTCQMSGVNTAQKNVFCVLNVRSACIIN